MEYLVGGLVGFAIGMAAQRGIGELIQAQREKQFHAWKK